MAGTGLPIPKNNPVLSQGPGVIDGDRLSSASAWRQIAAAGEQLARQGQSALDKVAHQQSLARVAEYTGAAKREAKELRLAYPDDPEGFEAALMTARDQRLEGAESWTVPVLRTIYARENAVHLNGIIEKSFREREKAARGSVLGLMETTGGELIRLASDGGAATADGRESAFEANEVVQSAVTAGLVSQDEAGQHMNRVVSAAVSGATLRTVRTLRAGGGRDAAEAALDDLDAVPTDDAQRGRIAQRARDEIESLDAQDEASTVRDMRDRREARDARSREGVMLLGQGKLDPQWVDQNADAVDARTESRLRLALGVVPPDREPANDARLMLGRAATAPGEAFEDALDSYVAGRVSKRTFLGAVKIAAQALDDDRDRPWAAEIRQGLAERIERSGRDRRTDALLEFSSWMGAAKDAARPDAQAKAGELWREFTVADRSDMRATLPLPRLAGVARTEVDATAIMGAHERTIAAARAGTMTLAEIASEAGILRDWREATATEA